MLRQEYSEKINWLGKLANPEKITATYQGRYLAICVKCPLSHKYKRKGRTITRKKNALIDLTPKQIEDFKKIHDVADNHNWTLIHISRTSQFIQKQMIGGKICQVIL